MADDFTNRIKIYYDAEFTGLHRNTSLISIGLVSQSGAYFYAEFNDYDESQVEDWLRENVIANLMWNDVSNHHFVKEFYSRATGAIRHLNVLMKGNKRDVASNLLSWLRWESEAYGNIKLQLYTDCYAYDWMTLMDLICEGGLALNIPEFIDYIPVDLSTAMLVKGVDPDINREEFVGEEIIKTLMSQYPFDTLGEHAKHNSLWDAAVACWCFHEVLALTPNRNGRIWSPEAIRKALDSDERLKLSGQGSFVAELISTDE